MWSSPRYQAKNDNNSWKISKKGALVFNNSPVNHLLPRSISTTEGEGSAEEWNYPEKQPHVSAPSPRLHAQQTFWPWAVSLFIGIIGRNLAEAQAERKRDVTLSVFKFLKKPWQQQAGKEGENKKQDVSMGALKQTQKYVPILTINRERAEGGKKSLPYRWPGLLVSHVDPSWHP